MPRKRLPPRLKPRRGRSPGWVIADGHIEKRTGCGLDDREGAERALKDYLARKHEPERRETELGRLMCADVLNIYLSEHAPETQSLDWLIHTATPCIQWWGDKTLADVRAATCREYVKWRCGQGVSDQTARHDLKTFRAAINYYHANYGPLAAVPVVTLPKRGPARANYFEREQAAAMAWAAYRGGHEQVLRTLLIGIYTGTRSGAIFKLRWLPSVDGGYFDLDRGLLYRRGDDEADHDTKRRPTVPIPQRLLPHLKRWRARDMALGVTHVVHYDGQPVQKLRRSWPSVRTAAGITDKLTPHSLRHTCVTWLLQAGVDIWEVAGFVGMSEETVRKVYGHHSPEHMKNAAVPVYPRKRRD